MLHGQIPLALLRSQRRALKLEFKYFLFVETDQGEDMISSEDLPDNRTCFRKPNLAGCRVGKADIDIAMRGGRPFFARVA
jgi:hypothetical protein